MYEKRRILAVVILAGRLGQGMAHSRHSRADDKRNLEGARKGSAKGSAKGHLDTEVGSRRPHLRCRLNTPARRLTSISQEPRRICSATERPCEMQAAVEQIAAMAQQLHDQDHDDDEGPSNDNGDGSGSGNGLKRKAEDGQTQQQRARRNRYVSIACNQCKRRKIKCNGETPCQRCGNLNLECVYAPNCCNGFKDSQEFKDMSQHISMLQDQINALWEAMNAMRIQIANGEVLGQQMHMHLTPIDPSLQSPAYQSHPTRGSSSFPDRQASPRASHAAMSPSVVRRKSQSQSKTPGFRGPTSSVFNFGVAKNSLETMGITSQVNEDINGSTGAGIVTAEVTPEPLDTNPPSIPTALANKDPIWSVSRDEALRLCRVYEDEMGVMYPVVDVDKVVSHATGLYRFIEAAHRTGLMRQDLPGADAIDDEDTNILKLILATALTVEACGRSELGHRLFESVQPAIDNMLLGNAGIKGVRLLTMAVSPTPCNTTNSH